MIINRFIGFEVITSVIMKSTVFWVVTPCSLVEAEVIIIRFVGLEVLTVVTIKSGPTNFLGVIEVHRRFGGTYYLHL
jgi:hypothetical protein